MDFSLSDERLMLEDSIAKFIANEYDFETRQKYAASDRGYSPEVWKRFADLGWTAVPFSEIDGGFGGGPLDVMILMQQFGHGLVVEPYLENIILAGGVLRRTANEAQKSRWLPPLIGGDLQATLAFVEPQSGYDLAHVTTRAERYAGEWVLDGTKGVVPNGGVADLLIVPARTSGDARDAGGISLFAVATDLDGIVRRDYPTVDGRRAAELELAGVRIGADALLGDLDRGFGALKESIDEATLAVCAEAVGIMRTMTDKTVEHSKNRVQFGVPIGSFQALQHRMVDMLTACEQSLSLLLWATMARAEQTDEAERAVSAIKYQIGTVGQKVGQEAVQLHGGMGVSWEFDIAHYFKRLTVIGQMFGNADWHLDKLAA